VAGGYIWYKQQSPGDEYFSNPGLTCCLSTHSTSTFYFFLNSTMIVTDKIPVENGVDYSFVCRKIPFAITCSTDFIGFGTNLIDMDLVNKMQIPIKNIKVKRMQILGQNVRSVGIVKQSVQCVINGKSIGTIHLTAKVIRDLFSIFNVDCVASNSTYTKLTGRDPPSSNEDDEDDADEEDNMVNNIPHLGDDDVAVEDEPKPSIEEAVDVDDPGEYHGPIYGDYRDYEYELDEKDKENVVEAVLSYFNSTDCPSSSSNPTDSLQHPADVPVIDNSLTQADDNHQDEMCKLCYMECLPAEIFLSHPMLHPRCPSMSEVDKRRMYGHKWKDMP